MATPRSGSVADLLVELICIILLFPGNAMYVSVLLSCFTSRVFYFITDCVRCSVCGKVFCKLGIFVLFIPSKCSVWFHP